MGKLRLKVCGLRQPEADQAALMGLDYMGFIFFPGSPRFVGDEFTFKPTGTATERVGVFVNDDRSAIVRRLAGIGSRIAQLHGSETPDQCEALRDLGYTVIKAFPVGDDLDNGALSRYHNVVDYFLFDTRGKLHGGNAVKFEWDLLRKYDQRTPFFLSGGIRVDDLEEIRGLRDLNLFAVDLNSGVEQVPGVKDLDKIRQAVGLMEKI